MNPRPSPWQGDALPLSYSRVGRCFSEPGSLCERRDLNPHTLRHGNLNPACLPVSPRSLSRKRFCFLQERLSLDNRTARNRKPRDLAVAKSLLKRYVVCFAIAYAASGYASAKLQLSALAFRLSMGDRRGLNPRHSESQSDALPTELRPPYFITSSRSTNCDRSSGLRLRCYDHHVFLWAWLCFQRYDHRILSQSVTEPRIDARQLRPAFRSLTTVARTPSSSVLRTPLCARRESNP